MAFLLGADAPLSVQRLAIPAVCALIAFLGYGSQQLFARSPDLAPGPLTTRENYVFNGLLLCLWWTYYRACTVDPGRYVFAPRAATTTTKKGHLEGRDDSELGSSATADDDDDGDGDGDGDKTNKNTGRSKGRRRMLKRQKHCRKCHRPKPPRSHHCRICQRCIPKMDHHCPWTGNCVSLQTFPHFLRFLFYANASLWTLLYLLSQRFLQLWHARHLPAYLGPTLPQLAWLTVFALVTGLTSLGLGIMLGATVKGWLFNTTTIEGWEIERHESLVGRRYETDDAFWSTNNTNSSDGGGSTTVVVEPVEFPYDIGIFRNMAQAMGTANPVLWLWPLAGGLTVNADGTRRGAGWEYEENELNDAPGMWPPADPEKARDWRARRRQMDAERASFDEHEAAAAAQVGGETEREAFRRRQERDLLRWERARGRILGELEELGDDGDHYDDDGDDDDDAYGARQPGAKGSAYGREGVVAGANRSGWVNAEGEQLGDFGVDEDAEWDQVDDEWHQDDYNDDEDVPLAELVRRRKVRTNDGQDT